MGPHGRWLVTEVGMTLTEIEPSRRVVSVREDNRVDKLPAQDTTKGRSNIV